MGLYGGRRYRIVPIYVIDGAGYGLDTKQKQNNNTGIMKRLFRVLVVMTALLAVAFEPVEAKTKKERADEATAAWDYEVETMGQNRRLGHVLKIWTYSKATHVAQEQCKKNAIHAVVFRGVPANDEKRLHGIRPLMLNAADEQKHAAFFDTFFAEGGAYKRFATGSNSGFADVLKVGKGDHKYKVGLTITVDTPSLRRYLEESGVLVSLNKGFN